MKWNDNEAQATAFSIGGRYYEEDTTVIVCYQRGNLAVEGGDSGHWWILDSAEAEGLVHFRLKKPLACGGSALACKITWDRVTETFVDGEEIKVFDDYGDRAVKGSDDYVSTFKGWAKLRGSVGEKENPDDPDEPEPPPEYTIVEIDHVAKFIEGRAYAISGTNSFAILLERWYDGQKPEVILGQQDEELVEVVDNLDGEQFFPRIPLGSLAWIKAIYDPCAAYYTVWNAQQMCKRFLCFAADPACGTSAIPIFPDYFERLDFSPFNLLPQFLPQAAQNPMGHAVEAFDWMEIEWDETLLDWIVTDVQKHGTNVMVDLRQQGCKIQIGTRQVFIERCSTAVSWSDAISLTAKTITELQKLTPDDDNPNRCKVQVRSSTICAFETQAAGEWTDLLSWHSQELVYNLFAGEDALTQQFVTVPVLDGCYEGTRSQVVLPFTKCTSSQSGDQGPEV
jgi:hypothetical protein